MAQLNNWGTWMFKILSWSASLVLAATAAVGLPHTANAADTASAATVPSVAIATAPTVSFGDVDSRNQFYKEITWLAEQGISTGWVEADGSRTYRPLNSVARDAMAAFLYRLAGQPEFTPPAVSPFADVNPSTQFYKEITWLAARSTTKK